MEIISERLRKLREAKNLTQTEVANILGVTQQVYSNYELEKFDFPVRHLMTLANLYDISTDYLLGRTCDPKIYPEYTRTFLQQVTIGDFVCRVTSFDAKSKSQLVDYVNFLTYMESSKNKKNESEQKKIKPSGSL